MAYSSQTDVQNAVGGQKRLIQLADWNGVGSLDSAAVAVIADAIAEADALIDSYASKRFAVPIDAPLPQQIVRVSARIAIYRLRVARGMPSQSELYTYEKDAQWLKDFAAGDVLAGLEPNPRHAEVTVDAATDRPTTKDVSRRRLRGFS